MSIQAHPEIPEFDYVRPASLVEACRFLARHPKDARPFSGGTDLFVRMRDGLCQYRYLVDIKHLDGTERLHFDPQLGLTIGAAVNMNRVIAMPEVEQHYPLLAEAASSVASYQLRTRATIAGNICNASPAGDTIGACLVMDAKLKVHGLEGERSIPLSDFYLGPGNTVLAPGDIVTAVHLPTIQEGSTGKYIKLGRNRLSDLAIIGVTVFAQPTPDLHSGWRFRIALASVAPIPLVAIEAEAILAENIITEEVLERAARSAQQACTPIDDVRGSARYRKAMVHRLVYQALRIVWHNLEDKT